MKKLTGKLLFSLLVLLCNKVAFAADSYRYMHVSIDTPWAIFVFLLFIVLFPFVLSAILYWYFTIKKNKDEEKKKDVPQSSVEEQNN